MAQSSPQSDFFVQYQSQIENVSKGYRTPKSATNLQQRTKNCEADLVSAQSSPLSDCQDVPTPVFLPLPRATSFAAHQRQPLPTKSASRFQAAKASIASQRRVRDESFVPCTPKDDLNNSDFEQYLRRDSRIVRHTSETSSDARWGAGIGTGLISYAEMPPVSQTVTRPGLSTSRPSFATPIARLSRFPWHKPTDHCSPKAINEEEREELAVYNPPQDEKSDSVSTKRPTKGQNKTAAKAKAPRKLKTSKAKPVGGSKRNAASTAIIISDESDGQRIEAMPMRTARSNLNKTPGNVKDSGPAIKSGTGRIRPARRSETVRHNSRLSHPPQILVRRTVSASSPQSSELAQAREQGDPDSAAPIVKDSYEDSEGFITNPIDDHFDFVNAGQDTRQDHMAERFIDQEDDFTSPVGQTQTEATLKPLQSLEMDRVHESEHASSRRSVHLSSTSVSHEYRPAEICSETMSKQNVHYIHNDNDTVRDQLLSMLPTSCKRSPPVRQLPANTPQAPRLALESLSDCSEEESPRKKVRSDLRHQSLSGPPVARSKPERLVKDKSVTPVRLTFSGPVVLAHIKPVLLTQDPVQAQNRAVKSKVENKSSRETTTKSKASPYILEYSGVIPVASLRPVQVSKPVQLLKPVQPPQPVKPIKLVQPSYDFSYKSLSLQHFPSFAATKLSDAPIPRLQPAQQSKKPLRESRSSPLRASLTTHVSAKPAAVQLNLSPRKRVRLASRDSDSSSTSSSADGSDLDGPTLVENERLSSLAPHQRRLYAALDEVSARLVAHLADRETALVQLGETYRRDGLGVVAAMQAEQDAAMQQYADAVAKTRCQAAAVLEDTLARVKRDVLSLGANVGGNTGATTKARDAVQALVDKYT